MQSGCASEHKRRRGNSEGPADKLGDGFRDLLMGGQRNRGAGAAAGGAAALPPLPQKSLAALKLLLQMRAHENECRVPSTDIYGLSATDRESVVEFVQEVCRGKKRPAIMMRSHPAGAKHAADKGNRRDWNCGWPPFSACCGRPSLLSSPCPRMTFALLKGGGCHRACATFFNLSPALPFHRCAMSSSCRPSPRASP